MIEAIPVLESLSGAKEIIESKVKLKVIILPNISIRLDSLLTIRWDQNSFNIEFNTTFLNDIL